MKTNSDTIQVGERKTIFVGSCGSALGERVLKDRKSDSTILSTILLCPAVMNEIFSECFPQVSSKLNPRLGDNLRQGNSKGKKA